MSQRNQKVVNQTTSKLLLNALPSQIDPWGCRLGHKNDEGIKLPFTCQHSIC